MPVSAPGAAAAAAAALAGGGVIAVPTDTLYGLACDAASAAGVAAIYAIKARPGFPQPCCAAALLVAPCAARPGVLMGPSDADCDLAGCQPSARGRGAWAPRVPPTQARHL
jgi:hypothetical protein